jgi:hypothetical protein
MPQILGFLQGFSHQFQFAITQTRAGPRNAWIAAEPGNSQQQSIVSSGMSVGNHLAFLA